MRFRTLGASGLRVSVVGLGCNNFGRRVDEAGTRAVVDAALDAEVTFFDTADIYGDGESETFLGRALAGRRDRVVLATKFGLERSESVPARGSREYIRVAVDGSLARLQTDYVDLYQYHSPDGVTPVEETLGALDELVREGKIRAYGSSNFDAALLEQADEAARAHGWAPLASEQSEYSWLVRDAERELLPACARLGVGFIPYYPLASGLLTGKYRRGEPAPEGTRLAVERSNPKQPRHCAPSEAEFDRVESLEAFARERGVSLLEVAIGGLLGQPAVASVIAGATKPEQVRANAQAGAWEPSQDDLDALAAAAPGVPA